MSRSKPYQPLILRGLHALNAVTVLLSLVTGFWLYNTWDGRFGSLILLPRAGEAAIDLHGAIGSFLLYSLLALAAYSLFFGSKRLVRRGTFGKLAQVGRPIWWYSLHQVVNTGILVAGALSLITGRFMDEDYLVEGQLNALAYNLHLAAWLLMSLMLVAHVSMLIKVGGVPLLLSIVDWRVRDADPVVLRLKKVLASLRLFPQQR